MTFRLMVAMALLAVSGCSTVGESSGTAAAGSASAGSGGLFGRIGGGSGATSASIVAAMDGGLIKTSIGTGLTAEERTAALEAEYRALEYTPGGQKVNWQGASGHSGEVVAAQAYRVGSQDCRQYSHTVFQGGGPVGTARGTACRNPDGSWTPLT